MPTNVTLTLNTAHLLLTLCVGICASHAATTENERRATLEAIHNLENPRNLTRPGRLGELGAYQFRETTWRDYSDQPFHHALERSVSDAVAVQHYEWLKQQLERARMPATPYNIALAWNGGIGAAISGRAPRAARNYAQRATNLAGEFVRTFAKETPMPPETAADFSKGNVVADVR